MHMKQHLSLHRDLDVAWLDLRRCLMHLRLSASYS